MVALAPDLARELAPRFIKTVVHLPPNQNGALVHVPVGAMWQAKEAADEATATGFSYLLAVEMGEAELAAALLNFADSHLNPTDHEGGRFYNAGLAPIYTTALFALGEAGGLQVLANAHPASDETSMDTEENFAVSH
ncbi:MAG: hypothetical protein HC876_02480 [Chloroflexaceae bacterium]|nr:hypothetical protein [Chloroflexaceae bacterium]